MTVRKAALVLERSLAAVNPGVMSSARNPYGWYEQLLTPRLQSLFDELKEAAPIYLKTKPDEPALKEFLLHHLRPLVRASLEEISPEQSIELVSRLIRELAKAEPDLATEVPSLELIRGLFDPASTAQSQAQQRADSDLPRTGLSSSELFTGRERHLNLLDELRREIRTADSVDIVVSFFRWSGLRLLEEDLRTARSRGVRVRAISTVYLGATEAHAIEALRSWGAEVYLSYNSHQGRLHAKAWIFHRPRNLGTAFIGSSNLSKDALTDGLEWNVKATQRESPILFTRTADSFEAIAADPEFERYLEGDLERLQEALRAAKVPSGSIRISDLPQELRLRVQEHLAKGTAVSTTNWVASRLRPHPFQEEVLDRLVGEREIRQRFRNLVVLPTGTGKTVVAALDYARQISDGVRPTLLFVAHREELLAQAQRTFANVLQDPNFGEIWKASQTPTRWLHVFASVATIHSRRDEVRQRWPGGTYFQVVILDEAHRAAADSYRMVVDFFHPKILLGLTATPERMDGQQIVSDFDNHFAAEVRLGEAIARQRLVPFHYFGVAQGMPDLSNVGWERGRYVPYELESKLSSVMFAEAVNAAMGRVIAAPEQMRALGFCSSIHQAQFLCAWFLKHGLSAIWVSGESSSDERQHAISNLESGELNIVFTVDLFNEGVDIPSVDTVLFLRPTESLTIFLQQLGRGLRLAPGKNLLTVLDFVGQANKQYDFGHKFQAMLGVGKTDVKREIENSFPSLPPGCAIILERQAEKQILAHLAAQIPSQRKKLLEAVAENIELSFQDFLAKTGWSAEYLVEKGGLWYQLREEVKHSELHLDPRETALKDWVYSVILATDSPDLLRLQMDALETKKPESPAFSLITQQLGRFATSPAWETDQSCWNWLVTSEVRRLEVLDWLRWRENQLDLRGLSIFGSQLRQFCSYDFKTIAWGQGRANWGASDVSQSGVLRISGADDRTLYWNLMVTVRKSESEYSRETLYRDWALSQEVFHWESPNNWVQSARNGKRFLQEIASGTPVFLFVRESKRDKFGRTMPYLLMGSVRLMGDSVQGERPIAMKFRLSSPLPIAHFRRLCQEAVS